MKIYRFCFFSILLMMSGCVELVRDYYHVKSPDESQILTFLIVSNMFEQSKSSDALESGIYMFVGGYNKGMNLPSEYLKLSYSDYSPIGIVWGDTIRIAYNFIDKNTFCSKEKVVIYDKITDPEYESKASSYREKTSDVKTAYDLDEIFRKYEVRPDSK
jgi:hypothetical protein